MEKVQENAKKTVKRVDSLSESQAKVYSLTKNEALELLEKEDVTKSEQMLNKWCRDGEIDALFISKGAPKARGLRINSKSLEAFILQKKGDVTSLVVELEQKDSRILELEKQLKEVRKELRELKEKGVQKPKEAKLITLNNPSLSSDKVELTFTYKRSKHTALFGDDGLFSVQKNIRGKGKEEVIETLTEQEKDAIVKAREELLESN